MILKADFRCKQVTPEVDDCVVEKAVELSTVEFDRFCRSMLERYPFIGEVGASLHYNDGMRHGFLVLGVGRNDGILVDPQGAGYARYSAFVPNARSLLTPDIAIDRSYLSLAEPWRDENRDELLRMTLRVDGKPDYILVLPADEEYLDAVKAYRGQLSDSNAIQLTWDGSKYTGTAIDTNGVLPQYYFSTNISGVTVNQSWNTLTVTATKDAAAQLNGYISSDYGYSLDVEGTESVLLEPSNGSNYQACAALTSLPDPVWAYIHFKVKIVEENGSITVRKVDATGAPLAGAELLLETSADGKTWTEVGRVITNKTGVAKWNGLKIGVQYRITEVKAPAGYTLLTEPLFTGTLDSSNRDVTITACNNAGFALPFTGGTGFTTYILFAALALMAGVCFCKKIEMKENTK